MIAKNRGIGGLNTGMKHGTPAARGIVAVATAVVWMITFSNMDSFWNVSNRSSRRKRPNPRIADCNPPRRLS
jgi:hypothetical protein